MPEKKAPPVKIKQDPEMPVAKKVLAKAVLDLSKAARDLLLSGLTRNDIVALISRRARGVSNKDIHAVLEAIGDIARDYGRRS